MQELGSFCIARSLRRLGMNAAIQLDDELMLHTKEVQDKTLVGMLPPKFQPGQATAAQCGPQSGFGIGWLLTQFTRRPNDRR